MVNANMKIMNRIFRYAFWKIKGSKTLALVGKSGTGKSFRSKLVAEKYHCQLIIDDGLLIKGDRIIAGKSAKRAENVLGAVRAAVFDDEEHQKQVAAAIQKQKYRRILIIGTSEKMVYKIAQRLNLPQPEKILHIEDIATKDEIENAMRIRYTEGKHVIPVPSIEVTRNYPQIVYDSLRVFLKGNKSWKNLFRGHKDGYEKTIVRPEFSKYSKAQIGEAALKQMVVQCLSEFDSQVQVKSVSVLMKAEGYGLRVRLRIPIEHQILSTMGELQEYIADSLEKYGSIFVASVDIEIEQWG